MKKLILISLIVSCLPFIGNSQIFYKIEGKDKNSPSYIFGSHHLAPLSIAEDSGALEILGQAQQVVGEIDMTMDPMVISLALQPYMMAPADSTLSVLLIGEDLEALNQQFVKWAPMPGMQLQMLDALKPVAVTTMIAVGMASEAMPGFDPAQQLDSYFMQSGANDGKKIIALETPELQGELLFNKTPLTIQAEALVDLLKNPESAVEATQKLTQAYLNRDLNAMFELSQENDEHPEFMEYILDNRNADWLTKLPSIIEEAPSFIVVGALHLAGEKGILEGLKDYGFLITPIY